MADGASPTIDRFKPAPPKLANAPIPVLPVSVDQDAPPVVTPSAVEIITPVSDEPYEQLETSFTMADVLPPRQSSDGKLLLRFPMLSGSYKGNLARMLADFGYTARWEGAPPCLDWTIESNYVVQAPYFESLLANAIDRYPIKAAIHTPDRVVSFKVEQLYRLDCQ